MTKKLTPQEEAEQNEVHIHIVFNIKTSDLHIDAPPDPVLVLGMLEMAKHIVTHSHNDDSDEVIDKIHPTFLGTKGNA